MYRNFDDWAIGNNINVSTNPHRDWETRKYVWSETEKFWRCWQAAEHSVLLTAVGVGWRARLANYLIDLACKLAPVGGR